MTLNVSIDRNIEARLRRLAEDAGTDVNAYVARLLEQAAQQPVSNGAASPEEFDRALEELFAGDSRKLPATALTYSREDIYIDHD